MPALLQTMREGAGTQHPEEIINFLTSRLVLTSGIWDIANNEFLVEESDTPAMSVDVRQGFAFLRNSSAGMVYPIRLTDADATVAIDSNSAGNPRIDSIVLYIDLGATANPAISNVAKLTAIKGTAAASPVAPDSTAITAIIGASNPYIVLADVQVDSGETTLLDADITDQRIEATYTDKVGGNAKHGIFEQAIINGNFDIAQRATTFVAGANNDDVYTLDRWNLLSDGNDTVDVSQEAITDLIGSNYAIKLDVETSKRFGIAQFIEAKDAQKLKGKNVSISFAVKSANIAALRCAILSWGGTADTITSDLVSAWADTPTWAANWTAENTPADLAVTSDWTTVTIENITLDSATINNLALFIWTPNQETIGDIIYISQVKINEGAKATSFMPKSYEEELRACQRYYQIGTKPGQTILRNSQTANSHAYTQQFMVTMRTTPHTYSAAYTGSGGDNISTITYEGISSTCMTFRCLESNIGFAYQNLPYNWIANAEL